MTSWCDTAGIPVQEFLVLGGYGYQVYSFSIAKSRKADLHVTQMWQLLQNVKQILRVT
jgi:hypothetical protein